LHIITQFITLYFYVFVFRGPGWLNELGRWL